jgi:hypothetical protein
VKTVSADDVLESIQKYLTNDVATPFIVVVDDGVEYADIVNGLSTLSQMHVSNFCTTDDAFPDNDALCCAISAVTQNTLLLGLGESVRLGGNESIIGRVKDLFVSSKVVVLCRGIREAVKTLCSDDKKFNIERRVCFLKAGTSFEVVKFPTFLNVSAEKGIKALLRRLESGAVNTVFVKTALPLKNIREVHSAYEAIQQVEPTFLLPSSCLSEALWAEYLADRSLEGYELFHWRTFLKLKQEPPRDIYLKYVIDKADDFDAYKKLVFTALLDFVPNDKRFLAMYTARKALLKNVKDNEIAEYIAETKIKDAERVYYLTDNTLSERQAIIETLDGVPNIPNVLKYIYPALSEYLYDYSFGGTKGDLLTRYFAEYKRQKLTNRLSPKFYEKVLALAVDGSRPYNSLKTRGEVLDSLNKNNTALYWMDALGAEYIGYIQSRAKSLGLKITVHTVRANLPTITSFNSDFYDAWNGIKTQTKKLDEVKHNGEQDFNYETTKLPIHLATELQIIEGFLEWSASKLTGKKVDKVILISDHGASRLAVINGQECKWEMASKGQHSGRCCPCSEADVKSEYATQENGFWVLANYDRFKGGRKASVEVHGGATLEEVVVPLIEVELFDNKITVKNTTPTTTTSFKKNAEIILFSTSPLKNVSIRVLGRQYAAEAIGNQKHKIVMGDIKKAGKYTADVFEGDNLIGQVEFEVQRESGKTNDSDWF